MLTAAVWESREILHRSSFVRCVVTFRHSSPMYMCLHVLKLLAHRLPVAGSSLFAGFKLFELDRKVGTSAFALLPDVLRFVVWFKRDCAFYRGFSCVCARS